MIIYLVSPWRTRWRSWFRIYPNPVLSGRSRLKVWVLNLDQDMVQELTMAFWEPSMMSKATDFSSFCRVLTDVYSVV